MAKLARRRSLTDGISPDAVRSTIDNVKEQVPAKPAKRHHIELPEWAKQAAAAATGGGQSMPSSERICAKRRVQLPAWALSIEARAHPPDGRMRSRAQTSGGDRFRLRMAEVERDAARRAVARLEAEIAGRSTDLSSEVDRLKSSAEALRQELASARSEACSEELGGSSAELMRMFWRNKESHTLEARAQSLTLERDRQIADINSLEEKLHASQANLASIRDQLQALETLEFARSQMQRTKTDNGWDEISSLPGKTEESHGGEESGRQLATGMDLPAPQTPASPQRAAPLTPTSADDERSGMPTLPPASRIFRIDTIDSPPRKARRSSRGRQSVGNDLEFDYEWGLELSTKMSIERALHLARWAGAALGNQAKLGSNVSVSREAGSPAKTMTEALSETADKALAQPLELPANSLDVSLQDGALGSDGAVALAAEEDPYAEPLAELQDALAVLLRASSSSNQQTLEAAELQDADSFDAHIADLQRACAILEDMPSSSPKRLSPEKVLGSGNFAEDPSLLAVMQAKQRLLQAVQPEVVSSPPHADAAADTSNEPELGHNILSEAALERRELEPKGSRLSDTAVTASAVEFQGNGWPEATADSTSVGARAPDADPLLPDLQNMLEAAPGVRLLQDMPLSGAFALRQLGSTASVQAHLWQKYAGKLQG